MVLYIQSLFKGCLSPLCTMTSAHPIKSTPRLLQKCALLSFRRSGIPPLSSFLFEVSSAFFLLNHKVMLNLFKEPFRSCWDNVTSVPKNIHVLYYIYRFGWGVLPLHFWNELSWYVIFSRYSWLKLISNEKCVYLYVYMCVFPWCIHPHMCAYACAGQDAVLRVTTWGYFCLSISLCPV